MLVDLAKLKATDAQLWRRVVGIYNDTTTREVDLSALKPETAEDLKLWHDKQELLKSLAKRDEPDIFREAMDPNEAERRANRNADEAAAKARLEYYESQGLEPLKENGEAITAWFDQNLKGYLSGPGVDAAVANLGPRGTNVLRWKTKAVVAPPAEPEQPEVLGNLPNGEPQLSLYSKDWQLKRASVEQLKDLQRRIREVGPKFNRPRGSFGSQF